MKKIDFQKYRLFRVIAILFRIRKLYSQRLDHNAVESMKPYREVYYSTVFAVGSAALAFMTQYLGKDVENKTILIFSLAMFGVSLVSIIAVYFIRTLHSISWNYVGKLTKDLPGIPDEGGENIKAKTKVYNDLPEKGKQALHDSFALMMMNAYLDLVIFIALTAAVVLYTVFAILGV